MPLPVESVPNRSINSMIKQVLLFSASVIVGAFAVSGQSRGAVAEAGPPGYVLSSPAYAEVVLWKTELEAEQEALAADYTDDFPRLREIRFTLSSLRDETARLFAIKAAEQSKLTIALGKLIIKKVEHSVELWQLEQRLKDEHPEVKRAKRKVEIYESAIKEILGG